MHDDARNRIIIQELKSRYIVNAKNIHSNNIRLKRNLQAEINKIESINKLIRSSDVHISELNRLEFTLETLLNSVRNQKCRIEKHQSL